MNFSLNSISFKSVMLSFTIGLLMFSHLGYSQLGTDEFTIAADDASKYSPPAWDGSNNQSTGFGSWFFDISNPNGGFAGNFIGSFSSELDINNKSFGLFANSEDNTVSGVTKNFPKKLEVDDKFTVSVGVNFRDGAKGFDLRNSSFNNIINFNVGDPDNNGSETYTLQGTDLFSNSYNANTVITFTFTQNADSVSWTAVRSGGITDTQTGTIPDINSGTIENIRFYNVSAGSNGDGGGARNLYFNNLKITSKYTIPNSQSSDVSSDTAVPFLDVQSGGSVNVQAGKTLTVNGDITNNGNIFFRSNNTGTAQLDEFNGEITCSGDVTVERFMPVQTKGTRAFRFLTSSVDSTDPIFDNWQESGNSPDGFGTHITGDDSGPAGGFNASTGIDYTLTGNPSMYTFDNSFSGSNQSNAWQAITDTKSKNLVAGEAYRIFIRGDRNYVLDSYPPNAPNSNVTLRATGSLLTGSKIVSSSSTQDFYSLVGNPYQATVDMSTVMNNTNTDNVNINYYWVWDPNVSTQGAYVAVQLNSGDTFEPGTNGNTAVSSAANEYVMPGQSFFVQTETDATADLEFTEASKSVSQTSTAVFSENTMPSINLKLFKTTDLNAQDIESDALQIDFSDQFSNAATMEDADKLGNPSENLASLNNSTDYLSIEKRELPTDGETLELFTNGYEVSDYTFVADLSNLPNGTQVSLSDSYTENTSLLNDGENEIQFTVDESIPGSVATDRFSLDFEVETFGVDDNELAETFKVYPNPVTDGQVNIKTSNFEGEATVNLYNMMGQRVIKATKSFKANGQMNIKLGNLQSGVYFIEINQNGLIVKERLIIN